MLPLDAAISKAVRHCAYLVASGHPEATVTLIAASRYKLDPWDVSRAWAVSRRRYFARDVHARRIAAVLMQRAGMKNAEAAKVLGVHPKHVRRMRKALRE